MKPCFVTLQFLFSTCRFTAILYKYLCTNERKKNKFPVVRCKINLNNLDVICSIICSKQNNAMNDCIMHIFLFGSQILYINYLSVICNTYIF